MTASEDTIFALATAPGRAGIAVVRLSGPGSAEILTRLGGTMPPPRSSRLCRLCDEDGLLLDEALVLAFAEGASFTGDSVVELHLHGSMAVIRAVLSMIERTGLARSAMPGEFTRRALLSGRLDLSQVQGLGDLIDAETEAQRRQAMRFLTGEMAEKVATWRSHLIRATALLEATIDFADEDVPIDVMPEVEMLLSATLASIQTELDGAEAAMRVRSGYEVALVGAPNVGKSSLLNRLTRSDAALVSDIAGTTRDVIEVRLDVGGVLVTFLDMAGIRTTDDVVESLGVSRALKRAAMADLRLFLHDGPSQGDWPLPPRPDDIIVRTKVDMDGSAGVSSVSGFGIPELLRQVGIVFRSRVADAGLVANDRDRQVMLDACRAINHVGAELELMGVELVCVRLRDVMRKLQMIIGGIETDAILDEIFASFCLGK